VLERGVSGWRVERLASEPLPQGVLRVSAAEPKSLTPRRWSGPRALADRLRLDGRGVTLVLPAGVARVALLDLPRGGEPRAFARFRLSPSLPFLPPRRSSTA